MGGARDAVLGNRCGSDCASGYGALRSAVQVVPGIGLDPADSDWSVCRIAGDVRDRAADSLKNIEHPTSNGQLPTSRVQYREPNPITVER
jgi:hypothetical protein